MDTLEHGLSQSEADRLQKVVGFNVLPEKKPPGSVFIFVSQFKSPLVYVLLIAGIINALLQNVPDTAIIFFAVFLNAALGFIQEQRASNALYALKQYISPQSEVIRDGIRQKIPASHLVPGDIVLLHAGDRVPADGELIHANRIYFDEAILTGESMPVVKNRGSDVYMGVTVTSGQGIMKLRAIGSQTKIGAIAKEIQEIKHDSPLKKQLNELSKKLVIVVILLTIFVFAMGVIRGNDYTQMFTTAIALAVSSIPEGLLISLTAVLAIGMQRILHRRGLVTKLSSAETLGGVTTICVDKTGTLTQGVMQVSGFYGNKKEIAKQAILANDLDDPLVISAYKWGRSTIGNFDEKYPQIDSLPFSSKERFFVSLHEWSTQTNMIFVNGAPDVLLKWTSLSDSKRVEIEKTISELTKNGMRLLGFARKEVAKSKKTLTHDDAKDKLEWQGILAFSDPVRPSVKEALEIARIAGIRIIVITGDYADTARFVLAQIGMPVVKDEIITGTDIEKISVEELSKKVNTVKLFARTTPEQKLAIVSALKRNGEVVGMMGDGFNDASALHEADIGITVSEGSDVARESSDLVLLDSNFTTIVSAIEEGRGIFDNIRKITLYLLCDAFSAIVLVIGSIAIGLPLPLTAIQIIWINLISDGFPNLALTIDPKRPGLMSDKPRKPGEGLLNSWMIILIGIVSISSGLIVLLSFLVTYQYTSDILTAQSMAFITLGFISLVYVFSVRSLTVPFWKNHLFENKWLIGSVVIGFCFQLLPFSTAGIQKMFHITSLHLGYWITAFFLSILLFMIIEICKIIYTLPAIKKVI